MSILSSSRTHCSSFHPCLNERACFLLGTRSGPAAKPGRPGPTHQTVGPDVVYEFFQRTAAVALAILDLSADLAERLSFPRHFTRCEMPFWVARHAAWLEVGMLMADGTAHGRKAKTVRPPLDRRLMEPAQFALVRAVAGGMAVDAALIGQHFPELSKQCR